MTEAVSLQESNGARGTLPSDRGLPTERISFVRGSTVVGRRSKLPAASPAAADRESPPPLIAPPAPTTFVPVPIKPRIRIRLLSDHARGLGPAVSSDKRSLWQRIREPFDLYMYNEVAQMQESLDRRTGHFAEHPPSADEALNKFRPTEGEKLITTVKRLSLLVGGPTLAARLAGLGGIALAGGAEAGAMALNAETLGASALTGSTAERAAIAGEASMSARAAEVGAAASAEQAAAANVSATTARLNTSTAAAARGSGEAEEAARIAEEGAHLGREYWRGTDPAARYALAKASAGSPERGRLVERLLRAAGNVRKTFRTPMGKRVVDAYGPGGLFNISGKLFAFEVKTYKDAVGISTRLREEIVKDLWLMRNQPGYNPYWIFADGPPSAGLAQILNDVGIPFQVW